MTAVAWMLELVEMAGKLNLFGEAGKHSPQLNRMSWEELVATDPGLIFISTCGFDKTSQWPN